MNYKRVINVSKSEEAIGQAIIYRFNAVKYKLLNKYNVNIFSYVSCNKQKVLKRLQNFSCIIIHQSSS